MKNKNKWTFGLGTVGRDMVYTMVSMYLMFYLTDVLCLPDGVLWWVTAIIMAARVFDAFNDPLMGIIVAKTKTKWGKFRPWLFIGTLLNAVILYFMFAAPPTLDGNGLIAYAAFTYILWGVTYTMMDIPFWSMIPAFTEGGKERESLSTLARSCAGVGSAIITATSNGYEASCVVVVSEVNGISFVLVDGTWPVDIYDMTGRVVRKSAYSIADLEEGFYLINGRKYFINK